MNIYYLYIQEYNMDLWFGYWYLSSLVHNFKENFHILRSNLNICFLSNSHLLNIFYLFHNLLLQKDTFCMNMFSLMKWSLQENTFLFIIEILFILSYIKIINKLNTLWTWLTFNLITSKSEYFSSAALSESYGNLFD